MPTFSNILIVLLRALTLGFIVFYATTKIPSEPVGMINKLIISAIVVVFYALMDHIAGFFTNVRTFFCSIACGCKSSNLLNTGEGLDSASLDTNALSMEVEEAIKRLDSKSAETEIDIDSDTDTNTETETETDTGEINDVETGIGIEGKRVTEEEGAKKATGLCSKVSPVPAETTEGFVNYSSW